MAHSLKPQIPIIDGRAKEDIVNYLQESKEEMEERLKEVKLQKIKVIRDTQNLLKKIDDEDRIRQEAEQKSIHDQLMYKQQMEKSRQQMALADMMQKKQIIKEIIQAKGSQVIRINYKKVEKCEDDDLKLIDYTLLQDLLKEAQDQTKENLEKKLKTLYQKYDYIERERREEENKRIKTLSGLDNDTGETTNAKFKQQRELDEKKSEENYQYRLKLKQTLIPYQSFNENFFNRIDKQRKEQYEIKIQQFKSACDSYKDLILEKAKELQAADLEREQIRKQQKELMDQENKDQAIQNTVSMITRDRIIDTTGATMQEERGRDEEGKSQFSMIRRKSRDEKIQAGMEEAKASVVKDVKLSRSNRPQPNEPEKPSKFLPTQTSTTVNTSMKRGQNTNPLQQQQPLQVTNQWGVQEQIVKPTEMKRGMGTKQLEKPQQQQQQKPAENTGGGGVMRRKAGDNKPQQSQTTTDGWTTQKK